MTLPDINKQAKQAEPEPDEPDEDYLLPMWLFELVRPMMTPAEPEPIDADDDAVD